MTSPGHRPSGGPRPGGARRPPGGARRPPDGARRPPPGARPPGGAAPAGVASRRAAWEAIRRVHADDAWASPAVDTALRRAGLDPRDRAFAANLAFATLRWEGTLDWLLGHVVDRDLAEVEPGLLDVLRMGAWQLRFGRVPDRAVVDTSVELARVAVGARTAGFTNGVLRNLARRAPELPSDDSDASVALRLGYPRWVVAAARERFGDDAPAVLSAGNEPPGLVLRAAGDRDALVEELTAADVTATPGHHPRAVHVPGGVPGALEAVVTGRATVQDEASMWVVDAVVTAVGRTGTAGAADPPGAVVDVCAGPGGKTTALVERGLPTVAADLHPGRAALVKDLAGRGDDDAPTTLLGVLAMDAARPALRDDSAAAVLVDAPCTGLGVVRRRPELRWRRTDSDPERLGRLQGELLDAAAALVRPGGVLVYSVCTWPVEETTAVVDAFCARHDGWTLEPPWPDGALPDVRGVRGAPDAADAPEPPDAPDAPGGTDTPDAPDTPGGTDAAHAPDAPDAAAHGAAGGPGAQLTPDRHGTDAMYVAVLRRPEPTEAR